MEKVWETGTYTLLIVWMSLAYYGRLHIWEIHGFPNQLPIVWENATVPILQGEIGTHTFLIV